MKNPIGLRWNMNQKIPLWQRKKSRLEEAHPSSYYSFGFFLLPSRKLTYPLKMGTFESMILPFPVWWDMYPSPGASFVKGPPGS